MVDLMVSPLSKKCFNFVMSLLLYISAYWWKIFSKGALIFLQFIETITFLTLSIHEINVLKSHDFRVIMQLHESFDYILTKTFYILTSVQCTYLPILYYYSQGGCR